MNHAGVVHLSMTPVGFYLHFYFTALFRGNNRNHFAGQGINFPDR